MTSYILYVLELEKKLKEMKEANSMETELVSYYMNLNVKIAFLFNYY